MAKTNTNYRWDIAIHRAPGIRADIYRKEEADRKAKRKPFKRRFHRSKDAAAVMEPCKCLCIKCMKNQVYYAPNAVIDDKICDSCKPKEI